MVIKRYLSLVALCLCALFVAVPLSVHAATNDPSLDYSVKAVQNELMISLTTGKAQGNLDIQVNPKGIASAQNRQPVDVAFVFDKSGSMADIVDSTVWDDFVKKMSITKSCNWFQCWYNVNDNQVNQYLQQNADTNGAFQKYLTRYPLGSRTKSDVFQDFSQINKIESAKNAVVEGLKSLGNNSSDTIRLIPFDSVVSPEINLKTNLDDLYSLQPNGGTNYASALQKANDLLSTSNRSKYIIFLTDGFPTNYSETVSVNGSYNIINSYGQVTTTKGLVNAKVTVNYDNNTGRNYSYFTYNGKNYLFDNDGRSHIRSTIESKTKQLAKAKMKLYSIGFGGPTDLDLTYLDGLSGLTGLNAVQGTAENINSIFRNISEEINQLNLSEVQIRIPLLSNVTVKPGSNVVVENNIAIINVKNIQYAVDQQAPQPITYSLPLEYSKEGTYIFKNIQMTYKDVKGNSLPAISHPDVTVNVKKKTAPTLEGTMSYRDSEKVGSLIKYSDANGNGNKFHVDYSLKALEGYLESGDSGTLSNIKIVQTLPKGISVLNADGKNVKVVTVDGLTQVEMTVPNINYINKTFDPANQDKVLYLQADWAMKQPLPNPTVQYADSNFGYKEVSIQAPSQDIGMVVRLQDNPGLYEGNKFGKISKIVNGLSVSDILLSVGSELQNGPVKSMVFKPGSNNEVVEVTYSNDKKAYIYAAPDFEVTGELLSNGYKNEAKFKLSQLVTGSDVSYQYQIKDNTGTVKTDWTNFTPSDIINLSKSGTFIVSVRANGGFAKENVVISKSVTIFKPVTSIEINPNPIELDVLETKQLTALVLPNDAFKKKIIWSIENPSLLKTVAVIDQDGNIKGLVPGEARVKATSTDGSNVVGYANVVVKSLRLESINFKQESYTIQVGDKLKLSDMLEFNPVNARNKNIEDVVAKLSDYVSVYKENGEWIIEGKKIGYSDVTAMAEERMKDGSKIQDSTAIFVNKDNTSNGGGDPGGGNPGGGNPGGGDPGGGDPGGGNPGGGNPGGGNPGGGNPGGGDPGGGNPGSKTGKW